MISALKELIVVVIIALAVFHFAKPAALQFTANVDFVRRRNTWFAVTVAAFLCPSFWLLCLVLIPILITAARKDSNPGALFLMLIYAVPAYSWRVPMVGISFLIDLSYQLLLSILILIPVALRLYKSEQTPGFTKMDFFLLAYLALTSIYFILPEVSPGVLMTPTIGNVIRRAIDAFFGLYIPYYVLSRSSADRRGIQDLLAAFCLSCAVMAAVGIFEGTKHWLLYGEMRSNWGPEYNSYTMRGDSLRAMASSGHPLVLGYLLAIAFGIWLSLKNQIQSKLSRISAIGLYLLGLLAAFSRGPWLGAVVIYAVFVALGGRRFLQLLKGAAAAAAVGFVIMVSPFGTKIVAVIPYFGGTVDSENITYRKRLFEQAWQIILNSPTLGDQYALLKMQNLRQGEGIIDMMNGVVNILLDNGFLGLFLFSAFILIGTLKAWRLTRARADFGVELATISASLVSCILGTLVMMWVGGLNTLMAIILVALAGACAYVGRSQKSQLSIETARPAAR